MAPHLKSSRNLYSDDNKKQKCKLLSASFVAWASVSVIAAVRAEVGGLVSFIHDMITVYVYTYCSAVLKTLMNKTISWSHNLIV